jgi:hypothetical protein
MSWTEQRIQMYSWWCAICQVWNDEARSHCRKCNTEKPVAAYIKESSGSGHCDDEDCETCV